MPQFELFSLYFLIMVAGHDTTRNAISGGVRAFLEHPDEFAKLQANLGLLETAADEVVRWSTPVNHFSRTATRDTVLNATPIQKGDSVALFTRRPPILVPADGGRQRAFGKTLGVAVRTVKGLLDSLARWRTQAFANLR